MRNDRDAAAFAYKRDIAVKRLAQCALCRLTERRLRIGEIPRAAVPGVNFHRHAFGQIFLQMRFRQFQNFVASLVWNETERQFRKRMTGDNGLCSLPLITSADSVDFGGRPRPDAFHRIIAGFPEQLRHTRFVANQFVAINRKFPPRFAFPVPKRLHAIVKSCNRYATFAIVKRGKQLRERGNRICNRPAKHAGMQIHFRTGHFDFESGDSAQAVTHGRHTAGNHSGI